MPLATRQTHNDPLERGFPQVQEVSKSGRLACLPVHFPSDALNRTSAAPHRGDDSCLEVQVSQQKVRLKHGAAGIT
jgi:hypothetical protein